MQLIMSTVNCNIHVYRKLAHGNQLDRGQNIRTYQLVNWDTLHQQPALCAATPYVIIPTRPIVTLCFYTYFATIEQGLTVSMI